MHKNALYKAVVKPVFFDPSIHPTIRQSYDFSLQTVCSAGKESM